MPKCYLSFQLKFFQGSLSHFVHVRLTHTRRHCEEQSDEAIHRSRTGSAFRDDMWLAECAKTCHRALRCAIFFPGLLRFARNDGKSTALSLATLNDFVYAANGTYVHSVKAMPQAALKSFACFSLLVHFLFLLRNQKEKMNNNLHNLCMWSIDAHNMCYVTNYLRYTAMTICCVPSPARGGPGWGTI